MALKLAGNVIKQAERLMNRGVTGKKEVGCSVMNLEIIRLQANKRIFTLKKVLFSDF